MIKDKYIKAVLLFKLYTHNNVQNILINFLQQKIDGIFLLLQFQLKNIDLY